MLIMLMPRLVGRVETGRTMERGVRRRGRQRPEWTPACIGRRAERLIPSLHRKGRQQREEKRGEREDRLFIQENTASTRLLTIGPIPLSNARHQLSLVIVVFSS